MALDSLMMLLKNLIIFSSYVTEKSSFPKPLSKEKEKEYLSAAMNGDSAAKDILIKHNLRLVAHIAKKYTNYGDNDELISIGSIGLIKAIESFKPDKGTQLATYASRCIENEILMHFRSDKKNNKNISIDESVGFDKEGNVITFLDILKTPKPDFALDIHKQDSLKLLKEYFNVLTEREKEIIIKPLDDNSFDELYIKMHNVLVDLKDIPVKDLFAYLLEALNIPGSISFDDKFSILRYRGLLREYQKASSIILYNGENLEDKDRALLNEIYGFNTTFFNVNDLLMSSYFSFYQTSSGLFLDSRENYTRVRAR